MVERNESGDVVCVYVGLDLCLNIGRMYFDSCGWCASYGRDVWIQNVCMYCNRCCLFCVSGFYRFALSPSYNA